MIRLHIYYLNRELHFLFLKCTKSSNLSIHLYYNVEMYKWGSNRTTFTLLKRRLKI